MEAYSRPIQSLIFALGWMDYDILLHLSGQNWRNTTKLALLDIIFYNAPQS